MDFLKEIVKEIGDEYTQLASEAESTETFIDTGSYIFNALYQGLYLVVYLGTRLPLLLVKALLERLSFRCVVKNFLDNHPDGYCLYFDNCCCQQGTP